MKNLLLLAIAITTLGVLTLAISCSKKNNDSTGNYTCTCVISDNSSSATDTTILQYPGVAKSTATTSCNTAQTTFTTSGQTAKCTLK